MIEELGNMAQARRGATWNSERQVLSCKDLKAFAGAITQARARRMEQLLVISKYDRPTVISPTARPREGPGSQFDLWPELPGALSIGGISHAQGSLGWRQH